MLEIILAVLIGAFTGSPVAGDWMHPDTERMTLHILTECPGCSHAPQLADAILTEAMARGIAPETLAAIAWTESNYQRHVNGSAGEVGIWQLIPGQWLASAWDEIREGPIHTSPPWRRLSRTTRRRLCRNIRIGTYLAAWIVDYHLTRCGDTTARCVARYQTGRAMTLPAYRRAIERRSHVIRGRLRGQ